MHRRALDLMRLGKPGTDTPDAERSIAYDRRNPQANQER